MKADYLEKHFYEQCYSLDEKAILELNEMIPDGGLNNVIVGLHNNCFGLFLNSENPDVYSVFYVNGKKRDLEGDMITLCLQDKERDTLLIFFSRFIAKNYNLDPLNVFNTFQDATRSMAEKLGYFTLTAKDIEAHKNKELTFFAPHHKGIIPLPFFFHQDLYRFIFGELKEPDDNYQGDYVYIMFNKRNKLLKIGKSKRPRHREKTLQAEEPEILMIAVWKADRKIEKQLHQLFRDKRIRGEWFDLDFTEVENLKKYMDKLVSS